MKFTEFEICEPDSYGPPCPLTCPDGLTSHVWELTIEEGQTTVTTNECPICNRGMQTHPPETEMWEMAALPVRLELVTERTYDGDAYAYIVITPEPAHTTYQGDHIQ